MGTSSSSRGPGSSSPLIPPHADASPEKPLPEPTGHRFRGFRTEFGRAISGGGGSLQSALQKYASTATGGSNVGPRRFGPAYESGANLAAALNDLSEGGSGQDSAGVDLSSLAGQPLDVAAQEIASALAPDNADADQVTAAIQEAMAEVLGEQEIFDPNEISSDVITALLVEYFAHIVFQEISSAAGDAWKKSPSKQRTTAMEAELLELVRVAIDTHLSPRLAGGFSNLSKGEIATIQQAALRDVWEEWEHSE